MKKKILIIFAVICVIAAGAGYYFIAHKEM